MNLTYSRCFGCLVSGVREAAFRPVCGEGTLIFLGLLFDSTFSYNKYLGGVLSKLVFGRQPMSVVFIGETSPFSMYIQMNESLVT